MLTAVNIKTKEETYEFNGTEASKLVNQTYGIFGKAFDRVFRNYTKTLTGPWHKEDYKTTGDVNKKNPGWYFIPMSYSSVIPQLLAVKAYRELNKVVHVKTRFLDAGCGPGNIMLLAQQLNVSGDYSHRAQFHGIELEKEGAQLGRLLTGSQALKTVEDKFNSLMYIHNTDILTFKHYKKFGIIYYYCPIKCKPLQILFEERLEDQVNVGTIILPNLKQGTNIHHDSRFKLVTCNMGNRFNQVNFFVKMSSAKRKETGINRFDLDQVPNKYHKMLKAHVKGLEYKQRPYY